MKASQVGLLCLKFAVTVALLWFVVDKVDLAPVVQKLRTMQLLWAIAAVTALTAQLLLAGIRWHYVGQLLSAEINLRLALRLVFVGQFFNQVLPTSVGGDGVRAWLVSREGIPVRRAIVSIICDRIVGLIILTGIITVTLPMLLLVGGAQIPSIDFIAIVIPVMTLLGLSVLQLFGAKLAVQFLKFPLSRPIGILIRDLRVILFTSVKSIWIIGLTVLVQTTVVLGVYLCARALNIEFGIIHVLMLPLILLICMVPISFAGWGVRESVMIAGLGFVGIHTADALAISVSFGVAQIFVGLPGAVMAVMSNYQRKTVVLTQ